MNKSDFKKSMKCGLGRCITELSTCKEKEKYRQIVLWGCLHNLSFDTQCEGTRAAYVYQLVSQFNDDEYFLQPAIEKFEKLPRNADWEFSHFCDLLSCFAESGKESAVLALHKKYDEIYPRLLKKRKNASYDYDRDNFERISIAITSAEGEKTFIKIATDMGNLFLHNKKYNGSDFEWFYICFEHQTGKKRLAKLLERESKKLQAVKSFYDNIIEAREQTFKRPTEQIAPTAENMIALAVNGEIKPRDRILFRRKAKQEQKLLLAQAVLDEKDLNKKAKLLSAFNIGGFPINLEEIISYAKSENEELRETAFNVLEESKGVCVHDFAIELLNNGQHFEQAVRMLVLNYQKQDKDLLLSVLNSLKIDYDDESGWHKTGLAILNAFSDKVKLPKETLLFIYNKTLCSMCREYAVRELAKHNWLTEDIKEECAFDSNYNIRNYINKQR